MRPNGLYFGRNHRCLASSMFKNARRLIISASAMMLDGAYAVFRRRFNIYAHVWYHIRYYRIYQDKILPIMNYMRRWLPYLRAEGMVLMIAAYSRRGRRRNRTSVIMVKYRHRMPTRIMKSDDTFHRTVYDDGDSSPQKSLKPQIYS